uniref:NB-ARC domain-containing protein n=1 Tax=Oryza punctata TaxID=4537 RepID=A0A0E0M7P9_ORYPU
MAIVLDAFASYVGDLLKQVAQDELTLLLGVSGEIASLHERLQGWVRKLKVIMYDATDILDLCHLKAMQGGGGSSSSDVGCLDSLLFCLRNPLFAHDIGSRIKALNARLDAICKSAAAFSFLKLEAYEDMAAPRRSSAAADAVVGEKIEEDTKALVKRHANGKHKKQNAVMAVAVVGTGGIGKTTLAKKVFNDESIHEAFDKKIWLSVTQDMNEVELLRTALKSVGVAGDARESNKSLLVPALVDAIRDKRFFLVLDDVWSDRAWIGLLKTPFSHGAGGSRVLLTTHHDAVARGMQAAHPFHHDDKLCPDDAWSLLKKQAKLLMMHGHCSRSRPKCWRLGSCQKSQPEESRNLRSRRRRPPRRLGKQSKTDEEGADDGGEEPAAKKQKKPTKEVGENQSKSAEEGVECVQMELATEKQEKRTDEEGCEEDDKRNLCYGALEPYQVENSVDNRLDQSSIDSGPTADPESVYRAHVVDRTRDSTVQELMNSDNGTKKLDRELNAEIMKDVKLTKGAVARRISRIYNVAISRDS